MVSARSSTADGAADGVGAAIQNPPARSETRRLAAFAGLGLGAYLLALIATFPAATALRLGDAGSATQASGSIWNGALDLGAGGTANWRFAPLRSLAALAVAAEVTVRGPGTNLAGEAQWRPGRLALEDVAGSAGWPLLETFAPNLPFRCDVGFRADIRSLVLAGARSHAVGALIGGPGACASKASPDRRSALPPVTVTAATDATGARAWIATQARPSAHLAEVAVDADGRLRGVVHAAGATMLPPGTIPGEMAIETRL
jgi:hypothetical protein